MSTLRPVLQCDDWQPLAANHPSRRTADDDPFTMQRPNPARMYDYLLGGKDNYAVDREVIDKIRAVFPEAGAAAWANRGFHQRAAKWMAQQGITQFVDIGCGLPTMHNTHDVVQQINPAARVAYVDHDPFVIAYARALLAYDGRTTVTQADLRDPASLLTAMRLDGLIEFAGPVGLLCTAIMHFVADDDDPNGCLQHLIATLAPGSYVAISHITADHVSPMTVATSIAIYADATERIHPRTRSEVEQFFAGLDIVPPYEDAPATLCRIGLWACEDAEAADDDSSQPWWAGVGMVRPQPRRRIEID